jgi:anaerobic magnesium-protoporphyrin IX monomethyl ester cyclase
VEMHLDLIVGLALDYFEDIKYSFEEVFKLYPLELQLGFLKFLKGTPVRDKANKHGFVYDPNPPYQIIESNYLSRAELHQIELVEHSLEVYWNKRRAFHTLTYVTKHYSIFDFFAGLGVYFSERKDLHQYTLKDIYELLFGFAETNYPTDSVLKQLITVDYYAYYKVKPQSLFCEELPRDEKFVLLNSLKLNHNKFRFVALPLTFDFDIFEKENRIEDSDCIVIFKYDGVEKATLQVVNALVEA